MPRRKGRPAGRTEGCGRREGRIQDEVRRRRGGRDGGGRSIRPHGGRRREGRPAARRAAAVWSVSWGIAAFLMYSLWIRYASTLGRWAISCFGDCWAEQQVNCGHNPILFGRILRS